MHLDLQDQWDEIWNECSLREGIETQPLASPLSLQAMDFYIYGFSKLITAIYLISLLSSSGFSLSKLGPSKIDPMIDNLINMALWKDKRRGRRKITHIWKGPIFNLYNPSLSQPFQKKPISKHQTPQRGWGGMGWRHGWWRGFHCHGGDRRCGKRRRMCGESRRQSRGWLDGGWIVERVLTPLTSSDLGVLEVWRSSKQ